VYIEQIRPTSRALGSSINTGMDTIMTRLTRVVMRNDLFTLSTGYKSLLCLRASVTGCSLSFYIRHRPYCLGRVVVLFQR